MVRVRYCGLSKEEKNRKRECARKRNHDMSEEDKQNLKERTKNRTRIILQEELQQRIE